MALSNLKLPLKEFLECFPSPQLGKVLDGIQDVDTTDSFDMGPGSVLEFHRKINPNITLSFLDTWGGEGVDHWIKVTVPLEFPGRFKLLPYDPVSRDDSIDHIYDTVEDLVPAFPLYVQANHSFGSEESAAAGSSGSLGLGDTVGSGFKCGDRLKLLRLVYRDGEKYLECRALHSSPRLLRLPMHCKGAFTVLPDSNSYLLTDLVALPLRKRRVQVCDSSSSNTNTAATLPGLPSNFSGELFIEEPDYFVEVSPAEDKSVIVGLPDHLEMNIAPDDMMERGQQLDNFATNNSNLFPLVARVTDWEEETTILENHYIRPGVELVIHGWTRQTKVLAKSDNQYYAIPLTYQGRFQIKPQRFVGVADLERAHPAYKVRVVDVTSDDPDCPIAPGDMLRIKREDSMKRPSKNRAGGFGESTLPKHEEIRYLKCEKFDPTGKHKVRDIKLPMLLSARFEEVLEDLKASAFSIRELTSFVDDSELTVELIITSPDQKIPERDLPPAHLDIGITLSDIVIESAVYVSVEAIDAPAFHIPLRTLVYVTFLEQLDKSSSPLLTKQSPKLSTLDRCVELLPEEVYIALVASKQGGPDFPRFQGATAFSGPSSTAWQRESSTTNSVSNGGGSSLASPTSPLSNGGEPVFSMQQQIKATRMQHRSTENLLQPPSNGNNGVDEHRMMSSRQSEQQQQRQVFDEFSFGPPVTQKTHTTATIHHNGQQQHASTLGRPAHVAVAHSDGGALDAQFRSLQLSRGHRGGARSVSGESIQQDGNLLKYQLHHSSQPNLLSSSQQNIPAGFSLVPDPPIPTSAASFQVPPGYALVPINQQTAPIPPGYALVPFQQQHQQHPQHPQHPLTVANVQQMQYGAPSSHYAKSTRSHRGFTTNGSMTSDSDNEDAKTNFSKFTFSSKVFKVAIPQDGNLYNFSTKKMAELFRQLKIPEQCIRACLKDRIDGKKFSKMMEGDLERYGLMHPVVLHFRSRTVKKKSHFML